MFPAGPAARFRRRFGALGLAALAAAPVFAAIEGYYRFTGLGNSTDALLANWKPFTSFSAGANRSPGDLRPNALDLYVAKFTDKHSPPLMQRVFSGQRLTSGVFYLRNSGESFPVFVFNLKGVTVNQYTVSADTLNDTGRLLEVLGVSFDSLETSVSRSEVEQTLVSTTAAWNFSTGALVTSAPPTLTLAATSLTTVEDAPATLTFTHSDDYSDVENITRSATSSNSALVAASGLAFSGTGTSRVLTVTPVANASGTATITVTLRDTAGQTTSSSFALTVNTVNDAPVVAAVATQTTTVGTPRAITISLSDADHAATALTLTATSDNATVLPSSAIALTGTGASRTLTLTPAAAGNANVTLVANDGSADSAPVTFTFIANPVGLGIPTDITLSAALIAENSAGGTVIGTLATVDADQASGHTFALIDDAGGRFALSGNALVVASGAALDYEAATTHAVTVRVTDPDNNAFSKQLTLTVTNVNEAPTVSITPLGAAAPGRALTLSGIALSDPDAGSDDIRVEFSVLHGTLTCDTSGALAGKVTGQLSATLVVTAPLADLNAALAAGALAYTPAAGFTGEDILQVVCSDLGHSGSGSALTDTRLAAIAVAVNSFASWQAANFSGAELDDPAISGAQANPAGDGLTNLLKYALGLDPHVATTAAPEFSLSGDNWVFTYTRPASRPDLTYAVEVSSNLSNWVTTGVTLTHVLPDPESGPQTWRATYPRTSSAPVFVRLRVTLIAP